MRSPTPLLIGALALCFSSGAPSAPAHAFVITGSFFDRFEGYPKGPNPSHWLGTDANSALDEAPDLFAVLGEGDNQIFGTPSNLTNIHSHFIGPGFESLRSYRLMGKLRIGSNNGGIGITLLSQYPNADAYYRIRRYEGASFHLSPHGTTMTGGDLDSGVTPLRDLWYRFVVEAEDEGDRTALRAKLWPDGDPEPTTWQIDAWDDGPTRLTAGRFGVWSMGPGSKDFDDFVVEHLAPPLRAGVGAWSRKPPVEPSIDRFAPGMGSAKISPAPTYRVPLIDDAHLVDDYDRICAALPCIDVVPSLGGGELVVRRGEKALRVDPDEPGSYPRWEGARSPSIHHDAWTIFLDVEILGSEGLNPALIAKRTGSSSDYWQLHQSDDGEDLIFAWRDGGTERSVRFEGGWPGAGRHQIVLTRNDGDYVYHLDGVEIATAFHPDPLPVSVEVHHLTLGALQSDALATNLLDAYYRNVWINVYEAISSEDVALLWVNPWRIYARDSLPDAVSGDLYGDFALAASGGTAPHSWSLVAGSLPPGLSLDADGVVRGQATGPPGATYSFTAEVRDAAGVTATIDLSLAIAAAVPAVDPALLLPTALGVLTFGAATIRRRRARATRGARASMGRERGPARSA
jgi:hypothetical protein